MYRSHPRQSPDSCRLAAPYLPPLIRLGEGYRADVRPAFAATVLRRSDPISAAQIRGVDLMVLVARWTAR
jgi:hypothetical protein